MSYDADFFTTLRERYTFGLAQDATDRKDAEEDVRFASGGLNQWDPKVVKARKKRPVLTEDRLGPSIAQVMNDGRQNKPSIQATPMDGGTEETAEYFQRRIRQIEYECDADIAYDTSREQQITCGRGFYRVSTKYEEGSTEKQCICIEPIDNQFSVVWDPSARKYDLSDAGWWFVLGPPMSIDAYERRFGKTTEAGKRGFFLGQDNPAPNWIGIGSDGEQVMVADYYTREVDEEGNAVVKIYATNGVEKLDETEWIGSTIPIVPVWGKQLVVEGVKRTYSLIRKAKDPQKLVNLYVSNIAEQISQMPKTPYIAAEGQIEGREHEWETINEVARAVVQYKAIAANGQAVGPPQRVANEPPIVALMEGYSRACEAVKATMGIFDAALGQRSNERSGIAIERRQKESDVTNFHFPDNEARSRKALGRILLEIIPKIDGEEPANKAVRDETGKVHIARINEDHVDKKTGKLVRHDMTSAAKYQVAISTGPSATSQRQEENDRQGKIIQAAPEMLWVMGDLFFASSDGPGAAQMAERMARAIAMKSPGLIEQKDADPRQQLQQATAKLQQLDQQNQALTQHAQELARQVETKQAEQQAKVQIVQLQEETKRAIADSANAIKLAIAQIGTKAQDEARVAADALAVELDQNAMAHERGMEAMKHAHQVLQGAQGADNAAELAAQNAQHASAASEQQAQQQAQQAQQQQPQQEAAPAPTT